MNDERMFPMLDGPWIPWWLAERVYEVYALLYPSCARDQSLERMAERGGFGWGEVAFMWDKTTRVRSDRNRQTRREMWMRFREPHKK